MFETSSVVSVTFSPIVCYIYTCLAQQQHKKANDECTADFFFFLRDENKVSSVLEYIQQTIIENHSDNEQNRKNYHQIKNTVHRNVTMDRT